MPLTTHQPSTLKLSICITTFNRAAFIGATLESILTQLTNDCEVVVLDGASTDGTEQVVTEYTRRFDSLRYVRQGMNGGLDRDCDRVVELARGEYCWLMTDDDLLKPGAVAAVLEALRQDLSLAIVNVEFRNLNMSKVLQCRWLHFESDRLYGPAEMDRLFVETGDIILYMGCIVIKRTIWLARERQRYYGSQFIHVGVIFQEHLPGEALVIIEPFISFRMGNTHTYSPHVSEILFVKWPVLVGTLALSESARRKVRSAEPWRNPQWLLVLRALGVYSLTEYRRWIRPRLRSIGESLTPTLVALLPGVLVNTLFLIYYSAYPPRHHWHLVMRQSRFYLRNWLSRLQARVVACRQL